MLDYDFDQSIGYWLVATNQAYSRAFNELLAPHGVTFRQAQLLGWLALEGPMSQTELASRMLIEPPSLVGILDRAEAEGWIERRPCSADRRRKLIHTLPAAEPVWKKIAECGREIRSQAAAGLTADEVETLRYLLEKVRQNVTVESAAL